jgi:serine/threonine protein kinase
MSESSDREKDALYKPGTVIADRYVVTRLIGRGGMGSVFEATHMHLSKRVAIKFLNPGVEADKDSMVRFQREAKIAGSIGHLNICDVLDFGITREGFPYYVMEYLEGESLAAMLQREGRLPVELALEIMAQVLSALEEVHNRGVIHRDMKPDNVFLTDLKGHGVVVKLLDFGISKFIKAEEASMKLTKPGKAFGTVFYMAPEQLRVRKQVDHRADLYAASIILYEMITGQTPYRGVSYSEVIVKILEDPLPDPLKVLPGLPPEIARLMRWGIHKNPARRPQSATRFREEVEKLQDDIREGRMTVSSIHVQRSAAVSFIRGLRRRTLRAGTVIGAVAAISGISIIVLFAVLLSRGLGRDAGGPAAGSAASAGNAADASDGGEEGASILIEVENAPPTSYIRYDGKIFNGDLLVVPRGQEIVSFTLSADGYMDKQFELAPVRDMTIDGSLEPEEQETSKPGRKKGPGKKQDGKDREKLAPKWEYPGK